MGSLKNALYRALRRSESFFKTDMVYLAKGGFWLTFMQIFASASSFILALIFANYVEKEVYGNYRYIISLAGIAILFSITGIGTAIIPAVARKYYGTFLYAVRIYFRWNTLIFLFSAIVSAYYLKNGNETLGYGMAAVALTYPFIRTFEIYEAFLNGTQDFKRSAIYRGIVDVGTALATAAAIFVSQDAVVLVSVNFLAQLVLNLFFFNKIRRSIPESEKHNVEEGVIEFSKHLSFQNIMTNLAAQLDKVIIFHYLGATQVAIYSFAIAFPQQMRGFLANASILATPKISNRPVDEAVKIIPRRFLVGLAILGPIVIAYIIAAPFLYKLFFPAYMESVPYSQVYALTLLIMGNLSGIVLTTQKAIKSTYVLNIISSVTQITLMFFLIHLYGIYGVIFAIVITKFSTSFISYLFARRLARNAT